MKSKTLTLKDDHKKVRKCVRIISMNVYLRLGKLLIFISGYQPFPGFFTEKRPFQ